MSLASFQELLEVACHQSEPQRLLLVFVKVGLPDAATDAQRERFTASVGGTLSPTVCVDKAPEEIANFEALVTESMTTGHDWDIVFVAAMSGRAGIAPSPDEATQPMHFMVNAINNGRVSNFAAFNRTGDPLQFM